MTRLRFTVKDEALVSPDALRRVKDVAGYFYSGTQHQLIVGPSTAGKLAAYFNERHPFAPRASSSPPLPRSDPRYFPSQQASRHSVPDFHVSTIRYGGLGINDNIVVCLQSRQFPLQPLSFPVSPF